MLNQQQQWPNLNKIISSLILVLATGWATPTLGAVLPSAHLQNGQTIGVGLMGISYDYTKRDWFMGGVAYAPGLYNNNWVYLGARFGKRFFIEDNFSVAWLVGLGVDQTTLSPDAGLGISYIIGGPPNAEIAKPLSVDLNVTVGLAGRRYWYGFGPNTTLALAYKLSRRVEIVLGGGTLIGARLSF
jgi:hypothetical protein